MRRFYTLDLTLESREKIHTKGGECHSASPPSTVSALAASHINPKFSLTLNLTPEAILI